MVSERERECVWKREKERESLMKVMMSFVVDYYILFIYVNFLW